MRENGERTITTRFGAGTQKRDEQNEERKEAGAVFKHMGGMLHEQTRSQIKSDNTRKGLDVAAHLKQKGELCSIVQTPPRFVAQPGLELYVWHV